MRFRAIVWMNLVLATVGMPPISLIAGGSLRWRFRAICVTVEGEASKERSRSEGNGRHGNSEGCCHRRRNAQNMRPAGRGDGRRIDAGSGRAADAGSGCGGVEDRFL
ncbi:hypothetical protein D3C73_1197680 [compost metagenome]